MNLFSVIGLIYLIMSFTTILAFAVDKMAAQRNQRRIPERVLHSLEWAGGWLGGLIGLHLLRHKRRKSSYTRVLYMISVIHSTGIVLLLWLL